MAWTPGQRLLVGAVGAALGTRYWAKPSVKSVIEQQVMHAPCWPGATYGARPAGTAAWRAPPSRALALRTLREASHRMWRSRSPSRRSAFSRRHGLAPVPRRRLGAFRFRSCRAHRERNAATRIPCGIGGACGFAAVTIATLPSRLYWYGSSSGDSSTSSLLRPRSPTLPREFFGSMVNAAARRARLPSSATPVAGPREPPLGLPELHPPCSAWPCSAGRLRTPAAVVLVVAARQALSSSCRHRPS